MAALDVADAMANVKTMLSGLTAWQTLCGESSSTEAAKHIYYGGANVAKGETIAPCVVISPTSLVTTWVANHLRGTLTVEFHFQIITPDEQRATIEASYLWYWQQLGALLAGINGAVGGAGQQMNQSLDIPLQPGQVDPDVTTGRDEWSFKISVSMVII